MSNGYTNRMSWTPRILAAIQTKKEAGVSLKAIAYALDCSYESLRASRSYDIHKREPRPSPYMPEAEALERIANVGKSSWKR